MAERDAQVCSGPGAADCFDEEARARHDAAMKSPVGAIVYEEDMRALEIVGVPVVTPLERRPEEDVHAKTSYGWSGGGALGAG